MSDIARVLARTIREAQDTLMMGASNHAMAPSPSSLLVPTSSLAWAERAWANHYAVKRMYDWREVAVRTEAIYRMVLNGNGDESCSESDSDEEGEGGILANNQTAAKRDLRFRKGQGQYECTKRRRQHTDAHKHEVGDRSTPKETEGYSCTGTNPSAGAYKHRGLTVRELKRQWRRIMGTVYHDYNFHHFHHPFIRRNRNSGNSSDSTNNSGNDTRKNNNDSNNISSKGAVPSRRGGSTRGVDTAQVGVRSSGPSADAKKRQMMQQSSEWPQRSSASMLSYISSFTSIPLLGLIFSFVLILDFLFLQVGEKGSLWAHIFCCIYVNVYYYPFLPSIYVRTILFTTIYCT